MHSALLIADYLIIKSKGTLTPAQILFLTYISHGYTLTIHKIPLISDDVQAWKQGPVIPTLFHSLRQFRDKPVDRLLYTGTSIVDSHNVRKNKNFICKELSLEIPILDKVLETHGMLSTKELWKIVYKMNAPWDQCYVDNNRVIIPDNTTQQYYAKLI